MFITQETIIKEMIEGLAKNITDRKECRKMSGNYEELLKGLRNIESISAESGLATSVFRRNAEAVHFMKYMRDELQEGQQSLEVSFGDFVALFIHLTGR